ncbi:MAG: hypothetical protein JWM74_1688, partial [Myxococcaceae bacterium]|nr:hypothetical protein [Myxococcaceae bacterium]
MTARAEMTRRSTGRVGCELAQGETLAESCDRGVSQGSGPPCGAAATEVAYRSPMRRHVLTTLRRLAALWLVATPMTLGCAAPPTRVSQDHGFRRGASLASHPVDQKTERASDDAASAYRAGVTTRGCAEPDASAGVAGRRRRRARESCRDSINCNAKHDVERPSQTAFGHQRRGEGVCFLSGRPDESCILQSRR